VNIQITYYFDLELVYEIINLQDTDTKSWKRHTAGTNKPLASSKRLSTGRLSFCTQGSCTGARDFDAFSHGIGGLASRALAIDCSN
jgi:hypothetical protein